MDWLFAAKSMIVRKKTIVVFAQRGILENQRLRLKTMKLKNKARFFVLMAFVSCFVTISAKAEEHGMVDLPSRAPGKTVVPLTFGQRHETSDSIITCDAPTNGREAVDTVGFHWRMVPGPFASSYGEAAGRCSEQGAGWRPVSLRDLERAGKLPLRTSGLTLFVGTELGEFRGMGKGMLGGIVQTKEDGSYSVVARQTVEERIQPIRLPLGNNGIRYPKAVFPPGTKTAQGEVVCIH
jgi:hypothetical protein